MSKITMQDIADHLGISRVTVWKALRGQSGVSDSLKQQIVDASKSLGYGVQEIHTPLTNLEKPKTISLVVSRPDSSSFWTDIIHPIAQELARNHINLMYTTIPPNYDDSFSVTSIFHDGTVQGAIILNIYEPKILRYLNSLSVPKVFLDTIPSTTKNNLNGDLLLIEGFNTVYQITKSLINNNINTIGFIGDISYAQTNLDRYKGFKKCLSDYQLGLNPDFCLLSPIDIYGYEEEIYNFLFKLSTWPDAFVCVSDFVAHVIQSFLDTYPEIPGKRITLTGFDNTKDLSTIHQKITTADVETHYIGKRIAQQIQYRLSNISSPYEIIYMKPSIIIKN